MVMTIMVMVMMMLDDDLRRVGGACDDGYAAPTPFECSECRDAAVQVGVLSPAEMGAPIGPIYCVSQVAVMILVFLAVLLVLGAMAQLALLKAEGEDYRRCHA